MTLTVGSLFSGIGGLDLGLERAGMEVIWQSEIDPYGCRVLKKHWPEVVNHGNIKEIKWGNVVRPDIICGGYPCQPFSTAGKRNGTDDPRHLWPWVREAISELRPKYAILENVRGHVSLGLNVVLGEMASIGYDAEWQIVSAASVGAPHRRDRVIIVAYPTQQFSNERGHGDNSGTIGQWQAVQEPARRSDSPSTNTIRELANFDSFGHLRRQSQVFTTDRWLNALSLIGSRSADVANTDSISGHQQHQRQVQQFNALGCSQDVADPDSSDTTNGRQCEGVPSKNTSRETSRGLRGVSTDTGQVREQQDYARGEESHAGRQWWATEPDVGRVANGVPSRVDRLRGLGNAVVPQVAELIGRMVIDYDTNE
jgi:DNA (cytosine-5)-methyltransferase 1